MIHDTNAILYWNLISILYSFVIAFIYGILLSYTQRLYAAAIVWMFCHNKTQSICTALEFTVPIFKKLQTRALDFTQWPCKRCSKLFVLRSRGNYIWFWTSLLPSTHGHHHGDTHCILCTHHLLLPQHPPYSYIVQLHNWSRYIIAAQRTQMVLPLYYIQNRPWVAPCRSSRARRPCILARNFPRVTPTRTRAVRVRRHAEVHCQNLAHDGNQHGKQRG